MGDLFARPLFAGRYPMLQKRSCLCGHVLVVPETAAAPSCPKCGEIVPAAPPTAAESVPPQSPPRLTPASDSAPSSPPPVIRAPVKLSKAESPLSAASPEAVDQANDIKPAEKKPADKSPAASASKSKRKRDRDRKRKRRARRANSPTSDSTGPSKPEARPEAPANENASPDAGSVDALFSELADSLTPADSATSSNKTATPKAPSPQAAQPPIQKLPPVKESPKSRAQAKQREQAKRVEQRKQREKVEQRETNTNSSPSADEADRRKKRDRPSSGSTPRPTRPTAELPNRGSVESAPKSQVKKESAGDQPLKQAAFKQKPLKQKSSAQEATQPKHPSPVAAQAAKEETVESAAKNPSAAADVGRGGDSPISETSPAETSANDAAVSTPASSAPLTSPAEPAAPPVAEPLESQIDNSEADEIALFEAPPVQSGDAVEYGVEHDPDRLSACYFFAAAMLLAALFGVAPSLYRGVIYLLSDEPTKVETWAFVLGAACAIQAAYAIYLLQAPDWSTAKVASIAMVVLATVYAAALGAIFFSTSTGAVVRFLQIFSYHADYRAAGWCFIMLLLTGMIAFFGGRFSLSWQQEETEMELL